MLGLSASTGQLMPQKPSDRTWHTLHNVQPEERTGGGWGLHYKVSQGHTVTSNTDLQLRASSDPTQEHFYLFLCGNAGNRMQDLMYDQQLLPPSYTPSSSDLQLVKRWVKSEIEVA